MRVGSLTNLMLSGAPIVCAMQNNTDQAFGTIHSNKQDFTNNKEGLAACLALISSECFPPLNQPVGNDIIFF